MVGLASTRASSVYLLSIRVDLLDAQRCGFARTGSRLGRPRRGAHSQGRVALQRAMAGRAPGLYRHRLVRTPQARRAVGGLPPVLHALPLSLTVGGLSGDPFPAPAERLARGTRTRRRQAALLFARSSPTRGPQSCGAARPARTASRQREWRGSPGARGGRLRNRVDQGERRTTTEACRPPGALAERIDLVGLRVLQYVLGRRVAAKG